MKLIIGLGNPGKKFEKNRHNFGFMALDYIREHLSVFDAWSLDKATNAFLAKGQLNEQNIILAKPQTFMNLSGQAAAKIANFFKIKPEDVFVIHDDIDLPLGVIRINIDASSAGHQGVTSVIEALGTQNFVRLRLGIKPTKQSIISKFFNTETTEKFVLKNFNREEAEIVDKIIRQASQAIEISIEEGLTQAMNEFN